jgi:hypothetical protein
MVPDDRSSSVGARSFDFNSQAGVLAVLGAIRASELSPADKNELRDLVFLYSNGGGDPAVRTVLEERLREVGITPGMAATPKKEVVVETVPEAPVLKTVRYGFSGARPVPAFTPATLTAVKPVVVAEASVPTPTPAAETLASVPLTPSVPLNVVVNKTPAPVVLPPVPVRPVVVVPPPVRASAQTIVPEPAPTPATVPVVPSPIPVPPAPAPIVEPPAPATAARLERIRVIKSDVNNRVGNPVNLVAMDKAVGSEYMSSLLEAMKLLSSASDVESERAMVRLETAYTAVENLLKNVSVSTPAPTTAPTPIVIAQPEPVVTTTSASIPSPVIEPMTPVTESSESATPWGEPESVVPVRPSTIPPRPAAPAVIVMPPVSGAVIQSVAASQAPLRSITELPTPDEVAHASVTGDPLFTQEVDAGLQQLLSEWSLFKKSGLFGTGPSGREHALFLKIAPLALPLVLSGRFEGSTQEIKQSITDYMNGWRYEQGIVYEKDETFEHYLRRVIRHIIDLQIKKRGA